MARRSDTETPTAVIVVDMLNSYEHEDADALTASVESVVEPIGRLIDRARESEAALIWVNDNYGDWSTSAEELGHRAMGGRRPDLVEPLLPSAEDAFVIKARHSIFYGTPLEHLLNSVGARELVLSGQVTEQCILYSALDAYVRGFEVVVPRDGVAHIDAGLADAAVEMMRRNMSARITDCAGCELG